MEGEEATEGRRDKKGKYGDTIRVLRLLIRRIPGQGLGVEQSTCCVFVVHIPSYILSTPYCTVHTHTYIVSYRIVSYLLHAAARVTHCPLLSPRLLLV
ncbi:hypothetical protein CGRA01v4_14485 [Colletotrichum graminicola]|nr:hypothetical protein CGRA01v4_14485 [Colletotrichum graminicola]